MKAAQVEILKQILLSIAEVTGDEPLTLSLEPLKEGFLIRLSFTIPKRREKPEAKPEADLMTDSQRKFITNLTTRLSKMHKIGLADIRAEAEAELGFPIVFDQLSKEQASKLITWLQEKLGER